MSGKMATTEVKSAGLQTKLLIWLILAQFIVQFGAFLYLYTYASSIESDLRARSSGCGRFLVGDDGARRKRSSGFPVAEDNAVSEVFKIRDEKESQKESRRTTVPPAGAPGEEALPATPGDQDSVWLTADTRIPYDAIERVCRSSRDYCPPGLPGVPGTPGPPGDRGLPGRSGITGPEGPPGLPGYPGEPGPKGESGPRGLDGRDGIPGEPGLDGVPGRSGLDGLPGMDGTPGLNGTPGWPGRNGTDGKRGERGPEGPPGPQGIRGMKGAKGNPGTPGKNGQPGTPGVVGWKVKTNDSNGGDLLIAPSILGDGRSPRLIVVREGANVRLRCAASGNPTPVIQWSKTDGSVIPMGSWHASSVTGHTLNITKVNREHMGVYTCVADNGIPPRTSQKFQLEVQFRPFIRIRNQMIYARNQDVATLICDVEAFPEPVTYWERGDGHLLEASDKYRMDVFDKRDIYKFKMRLNVTRINPSDHGLYHCIVKNVIDLTKGTLMISEKSNERKVVGTGNELLEIERRQQQQQLQQQQQQQQQEVVYGERAPPLVELDNLCPPQRSCDACPNLKCAFSDIGGRLEILPLAGSTNYTGIPARIAEGVLEAVGKPVFKGNMDDLHGSWMHDASPRSEAAGEKLWVTRKNNSSYVFEYNRKEDFKGGKSRAIRLPYRFQGNGHVVYNGSFFYNPEGRPSILRFDLPSQQATHGSSGGGNRMELRLPGLLVNTSNYLYTPEHNYNYVDFDVDENGLWAIYGLPSNNTVVMKVDAVSMVPQFAWNISVNHHKLGEMFIASGVLYAVHSVTDSTMKIRLALDLYKKMLLDVNLSFSNPFRKTTMIGYNYRSKELYTWDKGSQLAYPVRYQDIGNNGTKEEAKEMDAFADMLTGYEVSNDKPHNT